MQARTAITALTVLSLCLLAGNMYPAAYKATPEPPPQDAALDWVFRMENPALKKEGLKSVVYGWARKDLSEIGTWLNTQTERDALFDPAIAAYAGRLLHETPIAALSWAQQIQEPELREKTSVYAGRELMRENPDAVLEWLPTSGLSDKAQEKILKSRMTADMFR